MEPDLHVLSGPSAGIQRAVVGADGVGPGPGPRGREPVPRRGQNAGPSLPVGPLPLC